MSKANFSKMSRKELREYVLKHRDENTAFYAYVDKLNEEGNWVEMPPTESIDDLKNYPKFIEKMRKQS